MSLVDFPAEEIVKLEKSAMAGAKAKDFKASGWYEWLDEIILGAIDEKSMVMLRNAKTEEERIRSQMLNLSSHEIRQTIEKLINWGDGAKEQLKEISTQKEEGEKDGTKKITA